MSDTNNVQVAEHLMEWLREKGANYQNIFINEKTSHQHTFSNEKVSIFNIFSNEKVHNMTFFKRKNVKHPPTLTSHHTLYRLITISR